MAKNPIEQIADQLFETASKRITQMSVKGSFAVFETSSGAQIHRIPLEAFPKFLGIRLSGSKRQ